MGGGILLLDKKKGKSSAWSSRLMGRRAGFRKAGHLGTLDPMATGLLMVLLGEATKFATFASGLGKEYLATVLFGVSTDSGDLDGQETGRAAVPSDLEVRVREILPSFIGEVEQAVPALSAHKHKGKAFYSYVRRGVSPPARTKTVRIEAAEIIGAGEDTAHLRIVTGAGAYVRSIATSLGEQVGCGAALSSLRRTAVGEFRVEDAVSPEEAYAPGNGDLLRGKMLPIADLLRHMPQVQLGCGDLAKLSCGQLSGDISGEGIPAGSRVVLRGERGEFGGVAEATGDRRLRPLRMVRKDPDS